MYLPDCDSMSFTILSNCNLVDWWCEVSFCLFTWWFDTRFLLLCIKRFFYIKGGFHFYVQRGLASMVYNVFCKKSKADSVNIEIKQNEQLADKLQKAIIKTF